MNGTRRQAIQDAIAHLNDEHAEQLAKGQASESLDTLWIKFHLERLLKQFDQQDDETEGA